MKCRVGIATCDIATVRGGGARRFGPGGRPGNARDGCDAGRDTPVVNRSNEIYCTSSREIHVASSKEVYYTPSTGIHFKSLMGGAHDTRTMVAMQDPTHLW